MTNRSETLSKKIAEAKKSSGAHGCVECGRCVAVCPMAEMYTNFSIEISPRGIIKKTLMDDSVADDTSIWYCTECNAGTDVCPQGVSCRDLIRSLREAVIDEGKREHTKTCPSCSRVFVAIPVEHFVRTRLNEEPPEVFDTLALCPPCRRELYLVRNS